MIGVNMNFWTRVALRMTVIFDKAPIFFKQGNY